MIKKRVVINASNYLDKISIGEKIGFIINHFNVDNIIIINSNIDYSWPQFPLQLITKFNDDDLLVIIDLEDPSSDQIKDFETVKSIMENSSY